MNYSPYTEICTFTVNGIHWLVSHYKHDNELVIMGHTSLFVSNLTQFYTAYQYKNHDELFDLFSKYSENKLDLAKYNITFPHNISEKSIIVEYIDKETIVIEIIFMQIDHSAKVSAIIEYEHLTTKKNLLDRIKALEADNARLKQIEETNAILVDKFNILSNFIDLIIENNKTAELKAIIANPK